MEMKKFRRSSLAVLQNGLVSEWQYSEQVLDVLHAELGVVLRQPRGTCPGRTIKVTQCTR